MIIAIDFDGTLVEHRYPKIGRELPFAFSALRALQQQGHQLILWTSRQGELLDEAVAFCRSRGVEFYAVNTNNPDAEVPSGPAKIVADLYIDDRNLGGLPAWGEICDIIARRISFEDYYQSLFADPAPRKRRWWQRS